MLLCAEFYFQAACIDEGVYAGVDLYKILGGKTKILEEKWKQPMNTWEFLNYWGHVPGLTSKAYAYACR